MNPSILSLPETSLPRADRSQPLDRVRAALRQIVAAVSRATGVPAQDICSFKRHPRIAEARHLSFWLARELLHASLGAIGDCFPHRRCDHSVVLHACHRAADLMSVYPDLRARALRLREELRSTLGPAITAAAAAATTTTNGGLQP